MIYLSFSNITAVVALIAVYQVNGRVGKLLAANRIKERVNGFVRAIQIGKQGRDSVDALHFGGLHDLRPIHILAAIVTVQRAIANLLNGDSVFRCMAICPATF